MILVFVDEEIEIQIREHLAGNKRARTVIPMMIETVITTVILHVRLLDAASWGSSLPALG